MKIVFRSDTLLEIEDWPWLIGILMISLGLPSLFAGIALIGEGALLGGAVFGLVGGVILGRFAAPSMERTRLILDRNSGQITRTGRSLFGQRQQSYALIRLVGARVGGKVEPDLAFWTELVLKDPPEILRLNSCYTSDLKPGQVARVVNDWLGPSH